jgi:hypothetical protein
MVAHRKHRLPSRNRIGADNLKQRSVFVQDPVTSVVEWEGYRMNSFEDLSDVFRGPTGFSMEFKSMIVRTFEEPRLGVRGGQSVRKALPSWTKSVVDFVP